MRFKQWLEGFSGVGMTAMNGEIQDTPGEKLNTGLPVLSKISTKDGSGKGEPEGELTDPDKTFGFRSRRDKIASRERPSQNIDRDRRRVPVIGTPPGVIY